MSGPAAELLALPAGSGCGDDGRTSAMSTKIGDDCETSRTVD